LFEKNLGFSYRGYQSPTRRYALAIILPLVFALLRFLMQPLFGSEAPLLIFTLPVVLSAWFGGLGPGLVTTFLSTIFGTWFFVSAFGLSPMNSPAELARIGFFLIEGLMISLLSSRLQRTEGRLGTIVEHVTDAVITIDSSGKIMWWNPSAERIFGYKTDEVIGQNVSILMPEPYRSEHDNYIAHYAHTGKPHIIGTEREVLGRRKDGSIFPIDLAVSEFTLGNNRYFLGLARDITSRVREAEELRLAKEAAEAGNRAKIQFITNMSHEVRTPLGVIIGFTDLAREQENNPPETQRFLEAINRNALQLAQLVDEVLDLSRIEGANLRIDKARFEISSLLSNLGAILTPQARQRNLTLTIESDGPVPSIIHTDPSRLKQILLNIVENAIKFTDRGEVRIIIRSRLPQDRLAPIMLEFEVIDTGIGMDVDQQRAIFTPFTQGDASMARRYSGAGIGLALSRRFSQALGGDLILKRSEPARGSDFIASILDGPAGSAQFITIDRQDLDEHGQVQTLPYPRPREAPRRVSGNNSPSTMDNGARTGSDMKTAPHTASDSRSRTAANSGLAGHPAHAPGASGSPAGSTPSHERLRGRRLLLVEDSPDNRAMVARFLTKEGAAVEWAEDGSDGVKKAMDHHPDLVLMDIQMPVCDGYNATISLRKQGFAAPIVALTAHALREEKERSLRSGFDEYLTKPVNRDELIETVRRLTEKMVRP
jgi:PAS domain S-box-containing protein